VTGKQITSPLFLDLNPRLQRFCESLTLPVAVVSQKNREMQVGDAAPTLACSIPPSVQMAAIFAGHHLLNVRWYHVGR